MCIGCFGRQGFGGGASSLLCHGTTASQGPHVPSVPFVLSIDLTACPGLMQKLLRSSRALCRATDQPKHSRQQGASVVLEMTSSLCWSGVVSWR
jgi:hypothetical protein